MRFFPLALSLVVIVASTAFAAGAPASTRDPTRDALATWLRAEVERHGFDAAGIEALAGTGAHHSPEGERALSTTLGEMLDEIARTLEAAGVTFERSAGDALPVLPVAAAGSTVHVFSALRPGDCAPKSYYRVTAVPAVETPGFSTSSPAAFQHPGGPVMKLDGGGWSSGVHVFAEPGKTTVHTQGSTSGVPASTAYRDGADAHVEMIGSGSVFEAWTPIVFQGTCHFSINYGYFVMNGLFLANQDLPG